MNRIILSELVGLNKIIIIMALVSMFFAFPGPNYASTLYKSPKYSFSFELPDGWIAIDTVYSVMHYRNVFLCINNIADEKLAITNKSEGRRTSYNPSVVSKQLHPGTVYIDFAFFEGPGIYAPQFCGKRADTFEENRNSLFHRDIHDAWKTDHLTTHFFDFFKWGHNWSVFVYFREPVSEVDKLAAFNLIKNLSFMEFPITSQIQAGAIAAANVPQDVRNLIMRIEDDGGCGSLCLHSLIVRSCKIMGTEFLVTLELMGRADDPSPQWMYLVSQDGDVVLMDTKED